MIGFFDYTVWLTYASLLFAGMGIMISLYNQAHPFVGVFFLLMCGLCDAFDGRVARRKKNRSEMEKKYGIQIDSLADMVSFGVLPACIGNAMIRVIPDTPIGVPLRAEVLLTKPYFYICYGVILLYMLAALVRLAYYNVTEEMRQQTEAGCRKTYVGLPVTSAALVFPSILLLQYVLPVDITITYFVVMAIAAVGFVSKIRIRKPGLRGILIMVAIGAVEFLLFALAWHVKWGH